MTTEMSPVSFWRKMWGFYGKYHAVASGETKTIAGPITKQHDNQGNSSGPWEGASMGGGEDGGGLAPDFMLEVMAVINTGFSTWINSCRMISPIECFGGFFFAAPLESMDAGAGGSGFIASRIRSRR